MKRWLLSFACLLVIAVAGAFVMRQPSRPQAEKRSEITLQKQTVRLIGVAAMFIGFSAVAQTMQGIVSANGLQIAYIERGTLTAVPILFIQGVGSPISDGPDPIADQLVAAGFRWITFDNRDSGGSTHFDAAGMPDYEAIQNAAAQGLPLPLAYTLSDMADDAIGVLDALNIDRAHVVGGSLGGVIAQVIAAKHPDRVLSLTLISTTTGNPALAYGSAFDSLMLPVPEEREARIAQDMAFERQLIGPLQDIDEVLLRQTVESRLDRDDDPAATARQGITVSGDLRPLIAGIAAPTEVVHGQVDLLFPPEHGREVADSIPGAVLTIVPDMGHVVTDALAPIIVDAVLRAVARVDE